MRLGIHDRRDGRNQVIAAHTGKRVAAGIGPHSTSSGKGRFVAHLHLDGYEEGSYWRRENEVWIWRIERHVDGHRAGWYTTGRPELYFLRDPLQKAITGYSVSALCK